MNFINALPFMDMKDQELIDLFKTPKQKVIEISDLPTLLAPFKQYFHQVGLDSKYYTEDYFNITRSKYKNNEFSIFHVNIRSLNEHHVELTTYILLLQIDFDWICLSEIDTSNIEFYKHIFQNHICNFDLPNSSNIGGVAIYIKKEHNVT